MFIISVLRNLNPISFVTSLFRPGNIYHKLIKILIITMFFSLFSFGGMSVMSYAYFQNIQKQQMENRPSSLNNRFDTSAYVVAYNADYHNQKGTGPVTQPMNVYGGSVNASEQKVIQAIKQILGQDLTYQFFVSKMRDSQAYTTGEKQNMYKMLVPAICEYLKYNMFPGVLLAQSDTETSFGTARAGCCYAYGEGQIQTWNWWGISHVGLAHTAYWSGKSDGLWAWFNNVYDGAMMYGWCYTQPCYNQGQGSVNRMRLPKQDLDVDKQPTPARQIQSIATSAWDADSNATSTFKFNGMIANNYYVRTWETYNKLGLDYWDKIAEEIKNDLAGKQVPTNPNPQPQPNNNQQQSQQSAPSGSTAFGTKVTINGLHDCYISWGLLGPVPYYTIKGSPWGIAPGNGCNYGGGLQFNSPDPDEPVPHHSGYDFDVSAGTPVIASCNGTIIQAASIGPGYVYYEDQQNPPNGAKPISYGRVIFEETAGGQIQLLYAHLSKFVVHVGEHVTAGQIIGYAGQAGNATGVHVHFEIRDMVNNTCLNPMSDSNLKVDMLPCSHFYESQKFGTHKEVFPS